jgi:pimeloyl-ACP methyl ester carboxylesterase
MLRWPIGILDRVVTFLDKTTVDGVVARQFLIDDIPGVLWSPAAATGSRPLVLIGHGGGQHKSAPGVVARARRYVIDCGFAAAAIDAPGHGDRPRTEHDKQFEAEISARRAAGDPVGPLIVAENAQRAVHAVPDWRAALDAMQSELGTGPVGYWGLSLGSMIGIPFVAAEPRVAAAVFGLAGRETLAESAARITIPVEFLLQWDDELVARESGLALFDAFGSVEKTLHANPGKHMDVPAFEVDSSERFFARHLGVAS